MEIDPYIVIAVIALLMALLTSFIERLARRRMRQ